MGQRGGLRADFDDRSHQPREQIDAVDRLVHQGPAAIEFPGPPPRPAVVVRLRAPPGYNGVAEHQSTKSLLLNQVMHLAGDRIEAVLANDSQLHAGLLLHPQHLLNRLAADIHWFLDDHMPP